MATNFQDLVAKVKNLVALALVLGAILVPETYVLNHSYLSDSVILESTFGIRWLVSKSTMCIICQV